MSRPGALKRDTLQEMPQRLKNYFVTIKFRYTEQNNSSTLGLKDFLTLLRIHIHIFYKAKGERQEIKHEHYVIVVVTTYLTLSTAASRAFPAC